MFQGVLLRGVSDARPQILRGALRLQAGSLHQQPGRICAGREGDLLRHGQAALRGGDPRTGRDVHLLRGAIEGTLAFKRHHDL